MFPTDYWQQAWDDAQPRIEAWRSSLSSTENNRANQRVLRIGQLDAELLDDELVQLLQDPLNKAFSTVNPSLRAKWEHEVTLIIRLTLYKFSLWDSGATYGAKLQGLRYRIPDSSGVKLSPSGLPRRTIAAHALLTILIPYLHTRIRSHALSQSWPDAPSSDRRRKAWKLLVRAESTHALFGLASFLIFLWNGKYRTLADRLLQMRLVPSGRLTSREVSYEFMNRQMVWHAFTEFLLFILPLVNARVVRRRLSKLGSKIKSWTTLFADSADTPHTPGDLALPKGNYFSLPEDQCAICAENASYTLANISNTPYSGVLLDGPSTSASAASPDDEAPQYAITTPYQTSCGHTYCYYCLADRLIRAADDGEDGWECLRCTALVRSCERMNGIAPPEEALTSEGWDSENDDMSLSYTSDMSLESGKERSD
ncbi:hypothetical protein BD410DRAFT_817531 [Rickenella mellea]|uniref:RING-type E3 ubiquitin transferase (cysteine targeting) n=1 Tax=Rickenella mellea TaxID=50990 RepID=A0A4R5XEF7_9AGAM|nr:hypothetical protein BD410DRAFT_817531 [Rickenella mellea]